MCWVLSPCVTIDLYNNEKNLIINYKCKIRTRRCSKNPTSVDVSASKNSRPTDSINNDLILHLDVYKKTHQSNTLYCNVTEVFQCFYQVSKQTVKCYAYNT